MYANPGTKWACPITIPCRNQLTIKTLRVTLPATTLKNKNKWRKVTQIYYTHFNLIKGKKMQVNDQQKIATQ